MSALATANATEAQVLERVLLEHNLAQLRPEERVNYYLQVCKSLNLNPLTKPFGYIEFQGKLKLYAQKECTDQLRRNHKITIKLGTPEVQGEIYIAHAIATDGQGRTDEDVGAVSIAGLRGESLANAYMKAASKAKRRVTMSLVGLGNVPDETEIDAMGARRVHVDDDGQIVSSETPLLEAPDELVQTYLVRIEQAVNTAVLTAIGKEIAKKTWEPGADKLLRDAFVARRHVLVGGP